MTNDVMLPTEIQTENVVKEGRLQQMEEARQYLQRKYPNLDITAEVEAGIASDSVLDYAGRVKARLIVTGITSRNAAGQIFIGSTAVSIANNGQIPVLIVPPETATRMFNNIAFADDQNTQGPINGMDMLLDIVRSFDSNLEVVHVCNNGQQLNESVGKLQQLHFFDQVKHSYSAIEDENVEQGLLRFIERNHIDLLTVVHRYRGFLQRIFSRSHLDRLAYAVKVPMLILHQP